MGGDSTTEQVWDVIVIGAGPSGCAAAAILAREGWNVLILEKDYFPRYHLGESLIPYCWFPLKKIGILDQIKSSNFTPKHSVQFVNTRGVASKPFYFFDHIQHDCSRTWQVTRSEFDQLLLNHAMNCGAVVMQGIAVTGLLFEKDIVRGVKTKSAANGHCEYQAKVTIDASGRSMVSAARFGWRRPDPNLKKIAIWNYYEASRRETGLDEGATTVAFLPRQGWIWHIPLKDNIVSIGVVADSDYLFSGEKDIQKIYAREILRQPWIASRLSSAIQTTRCQVTNDYSYRSQYCGTDGLILIGDAFAFLDPMFSSGVYLALQSAVMAAETVNEGLSKNCYSADQFHAYGHKLCTGIESMRKLIYAFYNESFAFAEFLEKEPALREDLTDCLIGNLWKNYDSLFTAISNYCKLPGSPPYSRAFEAKRGTGI